MRSTVLFLVLVLSLRAADPLSPVAQVDLSRYAGTWFEIARTPNRYEKDCAGDVRLTYTLRDDGKLSVHDECRQFNGKQDIANGYAKGSGVISSGKLRVTFFWPFFFDYWIIDLDPDYRWAVVGEPNRRDLWVLGRTAAMEDTTYNGILARASRQGYDVSRLRRTVQ